jgi:hypothetical protein
MADANDVIHITECKLEKLVCQNARRVREAKQTVIRKDCSQSHGARMNDCLVAKVAQTPVAVYNFNLFANDYVSKNWEKGKDGRKGGGEVDYKKWDVIDFESVCEIADASTSLVCVGDDDYFVTSIDELARKLVDVRLDSACNGLARARVMEKRLTRLWEEVVANHSVLTS